MFSRRVAKQDSLYFVDAETKLKRHSRVTEAQDGRGGSMVQGGILFDGDGSAHGNSGTGKVEEEAANRVRRPAGAYVVARFCQGWGGGTQT